MKLSATSLCSLMGRTDSLPTRSVQQLIMAAVATHWMHVRPVVERMLASDEEEVRDAGGALASVAGLDETDAGDLLTSVLGDDDARIRRGVAKVLAARAVSSRYRERCAAGLRKLFDDEDASVREEAAKVSWRVQDHQLAELDTGSFVCVPIECRVPGQPPALPARPKGQHRRCDRSRARHSRPHGQLLRRATRRPTRAHRRRLS